jgi:hypothetical protein
VNDRLRIAGRPQCVPAPLEIAPQLLVVVDLAVEDDPDGPVFVRDRLGAVIEIDDAEAPHADRHAVADVHTLIVRASMRHDAAHGTNLVLVNGLPVPANYACDAAHGRFSLAPFSVTSDFRRTIT